MSDLTTLEKYKQLSQLDKDTLVSSPLTDPEKTIEIADRQLEQFETVNRSTNAVVIFLLLSFLAYSFGLPKSFPGFLGGLFSFLMAGFILGVISYLLVEVLFLIVTKIYFEKITNQKFKESVEKKWNDLKKKELEEIAQQKYAKKQVDAEIAQKYQSDFDTIVNYFSKGKSLLMPKTLLRFSADELAAEIINRTTMLSQQKELSNKKKNEIISYYGNLSVFLLNIEDDYLVEIEETLFQLNYLIQSENIQKSLKSDLLDEYVRISSNDLIKNSRDERVKRKYFEDFDKLFPSSNNAV